MTATHHAIVRDGSWSSLRRRPTPRPGRGEIVVAPEKVSLCGTDIQIVRGDRDDPSPIVGHEGAARVVAVGADVDSVTPGQRVVINPTHPGDPSFLLGHNVDGLFQQRVLIGASAVRAGLVAPIGESISSARATLIEPWAVVRYALHAMAATRPDTLLVIGDGLIGNLAAYLAPRVFGSEARTVVLHRTEEGRSWTAGFAPSVHGRALDSTWQNDCGDAVALLVSTHRDATASAVDRAVERLGSRLVAVHPIGGVPAGSVCRTLPGVDLAGVRAANTGGPWPPAAVRFSSGERQIVCTGNRGVTTQRLRTAADELAAEAADVDSLLTHDVGLTVGVEVMNALCAERRRTVDDRRVMRLVVTMNPELVRD
ncbi:MDR/zinc-dependent alcohol dehydrogenase-like family protein [Nocardia shimofusensis]|uniref:MDR/zinc-dependent alcohol dehydrogenase-like family protein n=1 Tax=Nocardia shimofusensis TaxID=228596 RepID=UPI00082F1CCE|nr:medium chain dehydrogenase/reductase family protein [Nocardia shimofusensis]